MKTLACCASGILLFAACGDNDEHVATDAPIAVDGATIDAGTIDAPAIDAPMTDGPLPFVPPTPFGIPLAMMGPDQLMTAAAAPGGMFYVGGFAAQTPTGARLITVARMSTTGPDPTFGTGGVATTALAFVGGGDEIDLVVQPSGKIVVSGTIANVANPLDRDVALLRLNPNGTLDPTFGVAGVRILDLNTAHNTGAALVGLDGARGLATNATGELYLHANSRGEGNNLAGTPRTDTDFTVVKLSVDGAQDLTVAGDGKFTLDLQESGANPRGIDALSDGVIASGYANSVGVGSVQPVVYKLTPVGGLIPGFASGGVFHEQVLALQTEIYGLAIHGATFTTGGYGRATGTTNDFVSLKFDSTTGVRDTGFGGAPNGAVVFDPSAAALADNCRSALALPGGKTLMLGSTGPGNDPAQDAVFAILTADGMLDTSYGTGINRFSLGTGAEQFWGAAVSGGNVLLIGHRGAGMTQTETTNDDSFGIILPLR